MTTFLAWWTLLALVAPDLDGATIAGTALAMHVAYAILCAALAGTTGYPRWTWTVFGFIGGVWAVALLVLLPRRAG